MNNLRRADRDDVGPFIELLEDAAAWQHERGITQWLPGSMTAQRGALEQAQADGHLLVVGSSERLRGGIVIARRPDPIWADLPVSDACYLNKLVVARAEHGHGLGERILAQSEDIARQRGCTIVRLDCIASNHSLVRYYQQRGYYPRGTVASGGVPLLRHEQRLVDPPLSVSAPFTAERYATLLFMQDAERLLLIRKKRGHGAGKINGPGGMVEPGETPLQCAVRETDEEVGMQVHDAIALAELRFQDSDGSTMLGIAFRARRWDGAPRETAEAAPFWCPIAQLPYESMWDDDVLWLPWLLEDRPVIGHFVMRDDRLVQHRLYPSTHAYLSTLANRRVQ
jgi:8-oxo-dGTP diphosphatase